MSQRDLLKEDVSSGGAAHSQGTAYHTPNRGAEQLEAMLVFQETPPLAVYTCLETPRPNVDYARLTSPSKRGIVGTAVVW